MPDMYITLDEAAALENLSYTGLVSRIQRSPHAYKTKTEPREGGGKPQVLVAVSSLSANARRAYKAAQRDSGAGADEVQSKLFAGEVPWYLDVDLNRYIENNKEQYYKAIETARTVRDFILYSDKERTAFAERTAADLGISARTLYRHTESVIEASAWAIKLEEEDGMSREYFKALCLCRKPSENDKFPSLPPEQRAVIENIWFDKKFAANIATYEMLYEKFCEIAQRRQWAEYPSLKTVTRYIKALMAQRGARSALYLAANGERAFKNAQMLKCKRDATSLLVMEFVQGDEHTLDCWVQVTAANGKVKAIRPKLMAWIDTRTRCLLGTVLCENPNSQTLKESFIKMIYSRRGGVPKHLHIDNGKDYTAQSMTGQVRTERALQFDAETIGFYRSMGTSEWSRSLPYEPWGKGQIERAFGTLCNMFTRWFDSYVGTLTGAKTYAKRHKDIDKMLERGELLTIEELYERLDYWIENVYHQKVHRGLKDAKEQWQTPTSLFENAPHYEKAAPPREYAAMLLMKADKAKVTNQGINKFNTLYTDYELCNYINQWVGVKWDIDDITKLYVYDEAGNKICEAHSAELLGFGDHVQQAALEEHIKKQKRQMRAAREYLENAGMPYEQRVNEGRPSDAVGKLDLMIGHAPRAKTIRLPNDKEYRAEMAAQSKNINKSNDFYDEKAATALARIQAMNE